MKYKEWLSVWLENYIKPSAKQRTYDMYLQMIENRIVPKIGDYDLDDLTPIVLQSFVTELLNSGNVKTHNSELFEQFREKMRNACPDCDKWESCLGGCPLIPEIVFCNDKNRKLNI